jgi:enoyl-CoA hydratase
MTLPHFKTLVIELINPYILKVTLNRPEVMNAINSTMMGELWQLWSDLFRHFKNIRCIILTGVGEKAFCAGADLKEREHLDLTTWQQHHALLQQAMLAMIDCPVPIIAAVNGVAYGGGLELALASDFIYTTESAVFAQSETKLGIMPGAMGTQNLPRACGLRRAKELCFTAGSFSAQQAYEWGIVNQLCLPSQLLSSVLNVAEKIAKNAPIAIQQAKKSLNVSIHSDIKSGYMFEVQAYNYLLKTKDRKEGISAFNQKREPKFNGEE